ncbi:MAG: sigma-54 dependent transcriptional regulator [Methylacidiphilales bacterium]|nr:sigma-54 dependent transcriptional regulator [Candidatus Methylacidiphilales bacterium]
MPPKTPKKTPTTTPQTNTPTPQPTTHRILIIDDEKDVHYSFTRLFENEPYTILSANTIEKGFALARSENPDLILLDIRIGQGNGLDLLKQIRRYNPKQIIIVITAYGTSDTAIEAMKHGAYDYLLKPFDIPHLKDLIHRALSTTTIRATPPPPPPTPHDIHTTLVGTSPKMQEVYKLIGQVAPSNTTVLILGESGTGKELVAHAIHHNSPRAHKPFLAINCAAIPENLLESELFGHERGSFTGAMSQRIGKFEQAHGGTLFLDEIGEMPLSTQAKILRVLQESEFTRIGSNIPITVDVRIIAATNRDLYAQVLSRHFREDLYYRLNVVTIHLPPLRERKSDIPLLVQHLLNRLRIKNPSLPPAHLSEEALTHLTAYHWPGNIRELENCLQRALVLSQAHTILPTHLPKEIQQAIHQPPAPHTTPKAPSHLESLAEQLAPLIHKSHRPIWPEFMAHLIHHLKRFYPDAPHSDLAPLIGLNEKLWQIYYKEYQKLHPPT